MLEVRNLKFSVDDSVPKHWHGRGRAVTIFFDGLSIFFPHGERFFISSVRARRHSIGTELQRDVALFTAQEGIHGREHDAYNEHLAKIGYPVAELEKRVERILRFAKKALPKRSQLAVTCALEHFTGMMALLLLGEPKNLDGAHPTMGSLWRWHAAEESEHKTVPFDVFRAAGGTEVERMGMMLVTSVVFWGKVFHHQVRLMHADGCLWSAKEWGSLGRFLFVDPGTMWTLGRAWISYFRPGFHPLDIDDGALLEEWKQSYQPSYQPSYEPSYQDGTSPAPA
ncbi:metal-dependent hydrolase [soil metagenome]